MKVCYYFYFSVWTYGVRSVS